jgi:3-deoxy-D-manno-octulosonic-acid transferase
MTRAAYALAWALATPFILLRLLLRSRRQPGYRDRIAERFGRYAPATHARRIWLHAVSVGETRAAVPVVSALERAHPGHRLLLTHMTPTGRETGRQLFGDRVEQAWLPYDYRGAARRFVQAFRPGLGIVLETEIWPRLLEECRAAGVPVVLANARLSDRSARRYARFPAFTRHAFSQLAGIAAQTEADAARFRELGARGVVVTGNVKFDMPVEPAMLERGGELRAMLGKQRRVCVAGSTRDGEEALLLDAFARAGGEDDLLVVVPRHPERFGEVASLAQERGLRCARRSEGRPVAPDVRVVVGDSMGEMLAYYAAADVVIMGGSLGEYGSQNLIEPCALGKPVVIGPSTYNFEEAADGAIGSGGAVRVADADAAVALALELLRDAARRERMGAAALSFVAAHRGAVDRLMAWLEATARIRD